MRDKGGVITEGGRENKELTKISCTIRYIKRIVTNTTE